MYSMDIYGCTWMYREVCKGMGANLEVCKSMGAYMNIYGGIWRYVKVWGRMWMYGGNVRDS